MHSASLSNAICSVLFVCFDTIGSDGLGVDDRSSIFRAIPASAAAVASHGYLFVQADAQERGAEPQEKRCKDNMSAFVIVFVLAVSTLLRVVC